MSKPAGKKIIKLWYTGAKIYWTKMMLLIVTAGYTEASKIQTTGPKRPKLDFIGSELN